MSARDYAPYVRDVRDALRPFLDGSVDPGDLEDATAILTRAFEKLGQQIETLIDEPDEQEVLRKVDVGLGILELTLSADLF